MAGSNIDDVSQEYINNLVEVVDAYIQQPQRQGALAKFLLISQYLLAKNQQLTSGN